MFDKNYSDQLTIAAGEKVKERQYWLNKLSGEIVKTSFPYDYKKKDIISTDKRAIDEVKFEVTRELYSKLMKLSKNADQTLYVILVAGLAALLTKYTGRQDTIVGSSIFKQNIKSELINKVLVLRNFIKDKMTFKDLLLEVKQTIIEAIENRNYPIEILQEQLAKLNMWNLEDGFPLFDIAILLENIHDKKYLQHINTSLTFIFLRYDGHISGRLEFNPSLYWRETIERIANHFKIILEKALLNLESYVSDIDILTEEEKKRLLYQLNDTRTDYPRNRTIHHLFEEQVKRIPDNTAVVFEDKQLTYVELNREANKLARLLRRKGIEPDAIVGIMVDRSMEMMVGILGILKAGGAYLPIDPEFPRERVIFMLEDCQASILLTATTTIANYSFTTLQNLRNPRLVPHKTGVRPQIKDLDRLPIPNRSLVNYEKYSRYIGQTMVKNSLSLQATRGCPYNCAYCHKIWPKSHVFRGAENIFAEVLRYYHMGVRRFAFIDDVFNLNIKNSSRFFQLIIEKKLQVQIFFPAGLRGDILTKEYIDLMAQAGIVGFGLALETASPRLQKLIGKNLNIEKLRENIQYICKQYPNIILELFIMTGFPTETKEEALKTLEFLKSVKWVDFPYLSILRIYSNTDMETLALKHGVSKQSIASSENLAFHEMPDTLPFEKSFMSKYQSDFLNEYFLSKERLLQVLPYQMKVLTEDELVQKYNSYLPVDIRCFNDLLEFVGITNNELGKNRCLDEELMIIPGLNEKIKKEFPSKESEENALRVLLLDLSQFFTGECNMLFDVVEPPLGLMYVMTYLNHQLGSKVKGKIAKSRIDFDSYPELKRLIDEFKPDVLGVRSLTFYKDFFHKSIAMIRQWGIDVPIIAGGPYATSNYIKILQDKNINLVVNGEGEVTFYQLIRTFMENGRKLPDEDVLRKIPGITFIPEKERYRGNFAREIVFLDTPARTLSKEPDYNLENINHPANLAYAIYTSGSTGNPKAVLTTHYNVSRVVRETNYICLHDEDRILQLSNFAFDGSVFDIYGALLNGSALVMVRKEDVLQLDMIADLLRKEKVTVFFVTTAFFNALVDIKPKSLYNIKKVLFGGERVSVEHTTKALNYLEENKILHVYGPTETTVYATYYPVNRINERLGTIPIGKPIANTTIYILDKNLKLVPMGIIGQICIGGDGVARGYLNNPELTSEKITPSPFVENDRMYFTGDLGKWLPDGNIEFVGRIDHQVKIRGFRIEPGEIESRLMKIDFINEALVIERAEGARGRYLCAYVVLSEDEANVFDPLKLKNMLSMDLPDYMVPQYIIQLEKMPLTPYGKVDRKVLPEPESDDSDSHHAAPRDPVEKKFTEIWSEVLGIKKENFGIDSDFFESGGHSLKATILVSKLNQAFNVKIPLTELFNTPTIRELAEYVKGLTGSRFLSIESAEEKEYYELSSAQKRLYVLQQMELNSTSYNVAQAFVLEGVLNKKKLEETFKELIKRHESLRTSFHLVQEEPVQKIHEQVEFEIAYYDKKEVEEELVLFRQGLNTSGDESSKSQELRAKSFIYSFIHSFDLSQAPLLRVRLLKEDEGRYRLMVDMHHIITDGTSMNLFIKEFMAVYTGKELPLLKLQYKDYSEWQNSESQKEEIKNQEEYWLNQFVDEIPVLNLPTDFFRPALQSFEGSTLNFDLSTEITGKLNDLALNSGATLYMVLLAICNILLSKISGQEDIIIGTPIAARRHADLEKIIGMFVNTLAIRNFPSGDKTFGYFLKEVKENTLEAFENQEYQFEDLVEKVVVSRDTSRNPIFDVLFALQNVVSDRDIEAVAGIPNLTMIHDYDTPISRVDLALNVVETQGKILLEIEYCTKLFKKETILRFINYLKKITAIVVQSPGQKISAIEIISEEEKKLVILDFNDTTVNYPNDKTIYQLFDQQVKRTPHNIALAAREQGTGEDLHTDTWTQYLTYRELNKKSNQLAYLLQANGVKADTIVGIMMEPLIKLIISMLAILKAGGAYLPIESTYPHERINYMLLDSHVSILLTQGDLMNKIEKMNFEGQIIDVNDYGLYPDNKNKPDQPVNPGNLVYVMYTSGSTGRPKGVMIEHRNVVRLIKNSNYIHLSTGDRLLLTGSIVFDITTFEIWGSLLNGLSLYLVRQEVILDGEKLKDILSKDRITILHLVPQVFNQLACTPGEFELFAHLDYLLVGGDLVKPDYIGKLRNNYSCQQLRILHMYGPTENTTFSTYYPVDQYVEARLPIGRPIGNSCVYVLDNNNKIQPVGIAGELVVAGAGVARGYLNQPGLTAEKFIEDPSVSHKNKLYRTGDLARWLPDGNLEFLGRIDHQVKIRGVRVELGEIENQLMKHEEIKDSIVVIREDKNGDKYLCAYVVPRLIEEFEKMPSISNKLREYLSAVLPDSMIPSYFVQLDHIPLTPNGKINRSALPTPQIDVIDAYTAPENKIEKKLVELWSEILTLEKDIISTNANFFELGGHSLKATVLAGRIFKELDVRVPLTQIFKTPTVKGLSGYIKGTAKDKYISIEAVEEKEYYPSTSVQERLYILQQMNPDNIAYNMPEMYMFEGGMDRERLGDAFKKLIKRHESLKTSFEMIGEKLVQEIHDEVIFEIEYFETDMHRQTETNPEGTRGLAPLFIKEFIRPFDLSRAPLFRVGLAKIEQDKCLIMVDFHHIVADGTSMGLLIKEFMTLYTGGDLPPLKIRFKDYARWLKGTIEKGTRKRQEEFWLKHFEGEIPLLNMPLDHPRPARQDFEGSREDFELEVVETKALYELAKKQGITLFMLLITIYNILLAKLSRQDDIVIGIPIAGRRHSDLENIIGMFVNTLALRNFPKKEKKIAQLLREVKVRTLEAFENQEYQFEDLIDSLKLNRDISRNPLFDVMFSFENINIELGEKAKKEIAGLKLTKYEYQQHITKFELLLRGVEVRGKLFFTLEYLTKLYEKETIRRYIQYFKNIVTSVLNDTARTLAEIEIVTEKEKQQVLFAFNDTTLEYSKQKTLQELVETQVEKKPDQVIAVWENEQVTYKELNVKANQVAWKLREKGVIPETVVGLILERSIEMVIGMLSVLKSGGAYLPLDPDLPELRNKFILNENEPKVLVIQGHIRAENQALFQDFSPGDILTIDHQSVYSYNTSNPKIINTANNLAYIVYTSGTSGKPKGILVEHRNVNNFLFGLNERIFKRYGKNLRMSVLAPYVFDGSIKMIYGALFYSHCLYIVPKNTMMDGWALFEYYQKYRIHISDGTPAHLRLLLEHVKEKELKLDMKNFISSGEVLPKNLVKRFFNRFPGKAPDIANIYGPTECCGDSALYHISRENIDRYHHIPIGTPLPNEQIYILNEENQIQPVGVFGELCISGDGVTRGYLKREQLSAEKFTTNPFVKGKRLYRTGDLARRLPDGQLDLAGRMDRQVKIRGFRIELEEIENQLLTHEKIKEAVVITREINQKNSSEPGEDKYLCGYIAAHEKLPAAQLKEYLSRELPAYMIPSCFVQLDKLPITPNGKIDRKRLPEPEPVKPAEKYLAPTNELEEKLVKIWSDVLGIDKNLIGRDTNFFDSGGHSLKAARMMAIIHKELDVKVPLPEIFKNQTIKEFSGYILEAKKNKYISINAVEQKEFYSLSSPQKRLYILQQMQKDHTGYNMPHVVMVEGNIKKDKLEDSFRKLIKRHETLRTAFPLVDNQPAQRIHDEVEFVIAYHDLTTENKQQTTGNSSDTSMFPVIHHLSSDFIQPFDLTQAPLLRMGLIKIPGEKHILMFDMHHIISDGTSMGIFMKEFTLLYSGQELEPIRIHFKDYSHLQNSDDEKKRISQQENFWLNEFKQGIPTLTLPTDYTRPAARSFTGRKIDFTLDKENTRGLKELAAKENSTLFMVLLAVYNVMLSRLSGQEDIVVGTPIAGRPHADLDQLIGMFVNLLPIRNYPGEEKTFIQFLEEVKYRTLQAFENQDYQFEELVDRLSINREANRNPLFDVVFAMQNIEISTIEIPGLKLQPYDYENKISRFDLLFICMEAEDRLNFTFEYSLELFKEKMIHRLIDYFKQIVSTLLENSSTQLQDIKIAHDLLSAEANANLEEESDFGF